MMVNDCYACQMLAGERPSSPGGRVYEGRYWVVEHAYPTKLIGWLVVMLKRHAETLQELTLAEAQEMGELLHRSSQALCAEMPCPKTYTCFFAESEHFRHVHLHVIPRAVDLPAPHVGPAVFALSEIPGDDEGSTAKIAALCRRLSARMARQAVAGDKVTR